MNRGSTRVQNCVSTTNLRLPTNYEKTTDSTLTTLQLYQLTLNLFRFNI